MIIIKNNNQKNYSFIFLIKVKQLKSIKNENKISNEKIYNCSFFQLLYLNLC